MSDELTPGSPAEAPPLLPCDTSTFPWEIVPKTLIKVLTGHFPNIIPVIIDSRFPYEYGPGHIVNAINIYKKSQLEEMFLRIPSSKGSRMVLIFHCEFSAERGPRMANLLRQLDRDMNESQYPFLYYPQVYLLKYGYKNFFHLFKNFPPLFQPAVSYVSMVDPRFAALRVKYDAERPHKKESHRTLVPTLTRARTTGYLPRSTGLDRLSSPSQYSALGGFDPLSSFKSPPQYPPARASFPFSFADSPIAFSLSSPSDPLATALLQSPMYSGLSPLSPSLSPSQESQSSTRYSPALSSSQTSDMLSPIHFDENIPVFSNHAATPVKKSTQHNQLPKADQTQPQEEEQKDDSRV